MLTHHMASHEKLLKAYNRQKAFSKQPGQNIVLKTAKFRPFLTI